VPDQPGAVLSWGIVLFGTAAVAAAAAGLVKWFTNPDNPIAYDKRLELEEKYGHWAVETAIAVCPHDDIRCIEREAERLSNARLHRRLA
jgi:hypothetical protein